ncbi:MAG: DMT family transporter [Treponemataceae bacterium]
MKARVYAVFFALAGMVLFWGLTPVTIAYVKGDFSILFQIWLRYLGSATALWIFLMVRKPHRVNINHFRKGFPRFVFPLILAAIFTLLFQVLYTYCFFLITPGFGSLLYQTQILFSLFLGMLFFSAERELIGRPKTLAGIFLVLAGVVAVLLSRKQGIEFSFNVGIFMALGAALAWCFVGITLRKWIGSSLHPLLAVTIVFTLVIIFLTPFLFLSGSWVIGTPGLAKWLILIGSGLLGIAGGQGLYYFLLPKLGLIATSSVQLLIPFVTGVFSYFIFGEQITFLQVLGGLVLLYGCRIILVQKAKLVNDQ